MPAVLAGLFEFMRPPSHAGSSPISGSAGSEVSTASGAGSGGDPNAGVHLWGCRERLPVCVSFHIVYLKLLMFWLPVVLHPRVSIFFSSLHPHVSSVRASPLHVSPDAGTYAALALALAGFLQVAHLDPEGLE